MGAKLGASGGPMAEMNVTPLIDVVLVLLVVFMVITPLLQSGLAVDLPVATTTQTVNDAGQHIVISVTVDKKWAVEQDEVDKDTIIAAINEKYRDNPSRSILVKADVNCAYEDVRAVMDLLAENNMTTVLIAASKGQ
jgi:biopolymer transport protein ExbD